MKKGLLIAGIVLASLQLNAQKLVIYESISGENCGPCAAANPGLWTKMAANPDKVLLVKYQTPIPSAGPIYNQNTADPHTRRTYYGINSAPNGRVDGQVVGGTHPNTLTQAIIDSMSSLTADFDIAVSHSYFANGDSMLITIDIEALNAVNADSLRLQVALLETLKFETPPGSNGETEFHNTVRKMYPNANGSVLNNTWTANQTENITMEVAIPSYVDLQGEVFIAVWIQENKGTKNKHILQGAKSPVIDLDYDASLKTVAPYIVCKQTDIEHKVLLKNLGTQTVTDVDIYSKINNGAYQLYKYSGSLNTGDTVTVSLGTFNIGTGTTTFTDSIGELNLIEIDVNKINHKIVKTTYNVDVNTTLPVSSDFNSTLPNNWIVTSDDKQLKSGAGNWRTVNLGSGGTAYDGSKGVLVCENYFAPSSGYKSYLYLPLTNLPEGAKALDFFYAYALRGANGQSEYLEVAYTEDCGETWTSVWKKTGTELATAPATNANSFFIPTQHQWGFQSLDVSDISGEKMYAFISRSAYANHLFLDNVGLRLGEVNNIKDNKVNNQVNIYPNPVQNELNISFNIENNSVVEVSVVNLIGQEVLLPVNGRYNAGKNNIMLSTNSLTNGIYIVNININGVFKVEKFVVSK